jgi:serine/threonine-protein kinase
MGARLKPDSLISGKYRILQCLGAGGMGEVYRARHELAGRTVALKLLRAELAEDQDLLRRFFQEAQAVNRIRHPNIVDVLDADYSSEGPYVVMECLEGATLGAILGKRRRLTVEETIAVLMQMLGALDAAHREGIVHRDLKPENVFVARYGDEARVKLVDFGIAKVLGDTQGPSPRTGTGVIFGTPDYLSPEQASGEGPVDGRSDLFAVGTLAFELLTGRRPFEAASAVATAYKIVHAPAPTLVSYGARGAERFQRILDVALAKAQDARFATAAVFAEALGPLAPDAARRQRLLRRLLTDDPSSEPPAARDGSVGLLPTEPSAPAVPSATPAGAAVARAPAVATPPGAVATPASSRRSPRVEKWTPRSIPAHVRGKCHMRGTLPRAVKRWIERSYGPEGLERVLSMLRPEVAGELRNDGFNALVWYDLEPIDLLMDAATFALLGGETKQWRELARTHFEADLGPIFRSAVRADATTLMQRLPEKIGRVLDFGVVKPARSADRWTVRFEGFEAASLALRYALLGTIEGMLRSAGVIEATLKILSGEASFVRELEVELAWKK